MLGFCGVPRFEVDWITHEVQGMLKVEVIRHEGNNLSHFFLRHSLKYKELANLFDYWTPNKLLNLSVFVVLVFSLLHLLGMFDLFDVYQEFAKDSKHTFCSTSKYI
ncbi:hypothetical protein C1H46_043480 [Malus baccata]|uniref:Uncharacterized protein n=1 Tax=Malus baccata TaxID=106549 RepID=A0A540K9U8_MALBA|nr:hypothetical protein C1H46_043480 [Malus baccata]